MVKDVEMRDGSAGSCGKSKEIVEAQRTYYMEGKTRALSARIDALNRLEQSILTYEQELYQALRSDLGKSRAESYMCEVGLTLSELRYVRRHVKSWSRNRRVHTPYGSCTVKLAAWNCASGVCTRLFLLQLFT